MAGAEEAASSKTDPEGTHHRKMDIAATAQVLIFTLLRADLILPLEKREKTKPACIASQEGGREEEGKEVGAFTKMFPD